MFVLKFILKKREKKSNMQRGEENECYADK